MGEPAIPIHPERRRAVERAREVIEAIRADEVPSYPRFEARRSLIGIDARENNEEIDRLVWLLASTLDIQNTALSRALDIADELNGDNGDAEELERRKKQIAELRAFCTPVAFCAHCGKRPATCLGRYEDHSEEHCQHEGCTQHEESPACDECCGHGNEDGACSEIEHPALVVEYEVG